MKDNFAKQNFRRRSKEFLQSKNLLNNMYDKTLAAFSAISVARLGGFLDNRQYMIALGLLGAERIIQYYVIPPIRESINRNQVQSVTPDKPMPYLPFSTGNIYR